MTPQSLTVESFDSFPPEARAIARQYIGTLRSMPLSLLPGFLDQIRSYDAQFPIEQETLKRQLQWLASRSPEERKAVLAPFSAIMLSSKLKSLDWIRDPQGFTIALSAYLWQSSQIDAYRSAAIELFGKFPAGPVPAHVPLVVAIIGRDAPVSSYPLFSRLREHGLYARNVTVEGAREALLAALAQRANTAPDPFFHWYIDGGDAWPLPADTPESVVHFTYPDLAPINHAVLAAMNRAVREGTGPEVLQSRLSHLDPSQLDASKVTTDIRLQSFYTSLLTLGQGTQIYSTSFMEAAAIEVLRRAQPMTLYLRFAPRRKQASINDLIEARPVSEQYDPEGSLVDADMAAYYAYLQLMKSPDWKRASFIVWVENRKDAFVAGPGVTQGVESSSPLTMQQVLSLALA